jgi:hypothetical protein
MNDLLIVIRAIDHPDGNQRTVYVSHLQEESKMFCAVWVDIEISL